MALALASRDDNRASLDGATLSHFCLGPEICFLFRRGGGGGGGVYGLGFVFFFPSNNTFFPLIITCFA